MLNTMVELVVSDILCKASDERAYVMILKEKEGNRKILVAIGHAEAQAVALALKGVNTKRPLTHDLFKSMADALGATLQCVVINKVDDGTFYSNMLFRRGEELCEVRLPPISCARFPPKPLQPVVPKYPIQRRKKKRISC